MESARLNIGIPSTKDSTMEENKSPKLYLNMIIGDFESPDIVKRAIDYLYNHVDGFYITVNYKTKKPTKKHPIMKLLASYAKKDFVASVSTTKWTDEFDVARNFAMDQVPKGNNIYIIWADADDVWMEPELIPDVLENMVLNNIKAVFLPYWYQVDLDENGDVANIITEQTRERIIINDGSYKWIAPLHETLIDQTETNNRKVSIEKPIVVHYTTEERMDANIIRNMRILEKTHLKQKGKDPRTSMYLAKTYFDLAKSSFGADEEEYRKYANLAMEYFGLYLEGEGKPGTPEYISPSGWAEERSTAWNYIAEIAILGGALEAAESALKSAIDESEKFPNYYVDLASLYIRMNKFEKAKHYLTIGTNLPTPKTTLISTPRDFKLRALEATAQIALHEKDFETAKKATTQMLLLLPGDKGLSDRLSIIESLLVFNKACQSAVYLGKYLEQINETDKIPHLINSFSKDMQSEKFASEMRMLFLPERTWAQNEITILAGPGFEEWTPNSLETGLGGSEEAIVYLAQELNQLGWKVTVYANPGPDAGDFDGVEYRMWYDLNPKDSFNVLVLWRGIGFVDMKPRAKFTTLWMHDVPNNPDFTKERLDLIDKVVVLSEFHKTLFRMNDNGEFKDIPDSKFWISSNGISDMSEFTK